MRSVTFKRLQNVRFLTESLSHNDLKQGRNYIVHHVLHYVGRKVSKKNYAKDTLKVVKTQKFSYSFIFL